MKSAIVAEALSVRQHFFRFMCGCSAGLLAPGIFSKDFLMFFGELVIGKSKFSGPENSRRMERRYALDAARK